VGQHSLRSQREGGREERREENCLGLSPPTEEEKEEKRIYTKS
jgi:hypothetical protein